MNDRFERLKEMSRKQMEATTKGYGDIRMLDMEEEITDLRAKLEDLKQMSKEIERKQSETAKQFADKIKSFIDEYSNKILESDWADSDKFLHSLTCETIYRKITNLAEQYGMEEK